MRKLVLAAVAASALLSTPALANEGRFGVRGSFDKGSGDVSDVDVTLAEGIGLGVFAGYDVPLGPVFVGAEVGADLSTADKNVGGYDIKLGRELSAVGRVGVNAAPNVSVYGLGGIASRSLKIDGETGTDEGFVWGLGAQLDLGSSAFVNAEYRRAEFDTVDDVTPNTSRVMIGAGLRF